MKKNMLMMFGVMALFLAGASARAEDAAWGDTTLVLEPYLANQGNDFSTNIVVTSAFKVDKSWSIVPDLGTSMGFTSDGKSATSFSLIYFRTVFTGPTLAEFGPDRKFGIDYRFTFPMDRANQQAGNVGTIKIRPRLMWKFNDKFSIFSRTGLIFPLQRNNYQIFKPTMGAPSTAPAKGNVLFAWDLEVFPGYQITENFGIGLALLPAVKVVGAAQGSSGTSVKANIVHEYSVQFGAWGLEFAPTVGHDSDFSNFKLFTAKGLYYYMDIAKKF